MRTLELARPKYESVFIQPSDTNQTQVFDFVSQVTMSLDTDYWLNFSLQGVEVRTNWGACFVQYGWFLVECPRGYGFLSFNPEEFADCFNIV